MPDSNQPKQCPRIEGCPMFAQFTQRSFLETWIVLYCKADYERCERYKLATAGALVPPTLLPNGRELNEFSPSKKKLP